MIYGRGMGEGDERRSAPGLMRTGFTSWMTNMRPAGSVWSWRFRASPRARWWKTGSTH